MSRIFNEPLTGVLPVVFPITRTGGSTGDIQVDTRLATYMRLWFIMRNISNRELDQQCQIVNGNAYSYGSHIENRSTFDRALIRPQKKGSQKKGPIGKRSMEKSPPCMVEKLQTSKKVY